MSNMTGLSMDYDRDGVRLTQPDGTLVHLVDWTTIRRWVESNARLARSRVPTQDTSWVHDFVLKTARIDMRHAFNGPFVELVVGEEGYLTKSSLQISYVQAAELMCRELPEEAKSFYLCGGHVCEVPKALEDWARFGRVSASGDKRYDVYQTRAEARAAKRAKLMEQVAQLDAEGVVDGRA